MQRRRFLGGLAIGGAALIASPTLAPAAEDGSLAPSLWPLFAPLKRGAAVGLGFVLIDLSPPTQGTAVLTLARGDEHARVHLSARVGRPRGVASSAHVDFVLMNDGDGAQPTGEDVGRVLKSLARLVAQNDSEALVAAAGLLPHRSASRAGRS
jgi:hypothetical protein